MSEAPSYANYYAQVPDGQQAPSNYPGSVRTSTLTTAEQQRRRAEEARRRQLQAERNRGIADQNDAEFRQQNPDLFVVNPAAQPGLGPRATTGQIMDYIAENYPGMIGFFNSNPEIRAKLIEAAKWGWSPAKLQAEVQATDWYRNTAVAARDFELLEAQDPETARAQVSAVAANIQNTARTLGLGMSGEQIAGMAWQAARNGWTDAQTIDALLAGLDWQTVEGGALTASRDDVMALAGDYLVALSESTAQNYARRIASGELTLEGVRSILQTQAKARFSWMDSQLDQGVTPSDYFAPVRDVIARTLEVTPEEIDLMSPQWLGLVEVRDRETGQMRAATMNEAMLSARNRTQWIDTQGAQEMSAGLIQMTREAFGL